MAEKKTSTSKPAKASTKEAGNKSGKAAAKKPADKPMASSSAGKATTKKTKTGLIWGLIIAAVAVIIGVVVAVLCLNKTDGADPTANISYSKSFFIYDDGKYTLWNADGQRITEDEYQSQSSFIGGYALVKRDDQYGIINENGRMSVDYGKYGSISSKGGLYLAEDGNTKEQFLITGSGKVLAKGEKLDIETASLSGGFAAVVADGKMRVYNYAGTLVAETDEIDGEEPAMNSSRDYGIAHYGDQNWVFDARNGQVVATFNGPRYSFDTISEDRTMILLEDYDDSNKYKLIANGKIYDLDETKNYGLTDLNQVLGYDNYDELALLNNDYKVARRVNTYLQLKDTDNFAEQKNDGGVEIYYNGQKVKEFGEDAEIVVSGLLYNDLYAIRDGEKVKFYNLDGSVAFDKEFEDVYVLSDKNHHAVVAENEGEYYLMDAKGNRISEAVAKSIVPYDNGYKAKNSDGKYAILDKNGKPVTDFKYTEVSYRSAAEPRNLWTGKNENGMTDLIDVDSGKAIFGGAEIDGVYDNFFTVKTAEGTTEYYTLDGELFYTKAKK